MHRNLFILLLVVLVSYLNAKLFKQQFTFPALRRNKGWQFLDRMKLGQGIAQIRFNAQMIVKEDQTTRTYAVELAMVPDRLWNKQQLMKCSRQGQTLVQQQKQQNGNNLSKQTIFTTTLSLQNNYTYGFLQTVNIPQTQTYHFIFRDCQKHIISDYFWRQSRLVIELQIKNNGRDYGEDQGGNFYWFPILIIGTILMLKTVSKDAFSKSIDAKQHDHVKLLVISCIWINLISLLFKYIGYLIYYFFGVQYQFFDFVYLFFHSVGDSVIVSIFLFVSYGWTITFISGKDFDLYVPLVCMMGLITLILTLLNKITDGTHDKYHMYDTIPAYLLVFFKSITLIIFVVGCIKTYVQSAKQQNIRKFMIQILVLGGLYIASIPLIMLVVEYLPQSARKQWVFILIELGKTFICFLLTYMISYKKSGYRTIYFEDQTFMRANGKML